MNNEYFINELNNLEILTNINIFKKNNLKLNKLRNINKIIKECNKQKKKKILQLSNELKVMSGGSIIVDKIKSIQTNILCDIDNLNKVINIINIYNSNFIEIYSNEFI